MEKNQEIVGKQNEALVLSGKHCAWGHLIEEMSPYVGEALSKAFPDVQLKSSNKGVQQPFSGRNIPPAMLISMPTLPQLFFQDKILMKPYCNLEQQPALLIREKQ
jgi:hypothetical protein